MKKTWKKAVAAVISAALLVSGVTTSTQHAEAKAKKNITISKKVNVTVGKTTRIKLKNNRGKVQWKVTAGKKLIRITKKTKTSATVKGIKKGTAMVQAKIERKKYTCMVNVSDATKKPVVTNKPQPTQKSESKPTSPINTPESTANLTSDAPKSTAASTSDTPVATATSTANTLTPTPTSAVNTPAPTPTSAVNTPIPTAAPTIPPGLKTIIYDGTNESEIKNAYGPIAVIVADGVTEIKDSAFAGCSNLAYITIPDSVTYIGWRAFASCSNLTSITLPNSVTGIRERAFVGSGLTSITIPNSMTEIDYEAFMGCRRMTSITIPNSVTHIASDAFYLCSSLESITIPDSVEWIGLGAFKGCPSLTSIQVSPGNKVYDSRDNCNAIIRSGTNSLIVGCVETNIPDGVTSIAAAAFADCSNLTSITIPDSVEGIWGGDESYGAFEDCENLQSITIPASVRIIDMHAFAGCKNLASITIPDGVTISKRAFLGSGLTSITIPDSASIGKEAFIFCRSLTSITISDNVTSIEDSAFSGCSSLTSITWKDTIYNNWWTFMEDFKSTNNEM